MIRINEIKLPLDAAAEQSLYPAAAKALKIDRKRIQSLEVVRKSIDSRKRRRAFSSSILSTYRSTAAKRSCLPARRGRAYSPRSLTGMNRPGQRAIPSCAPLWSASAQRAFLQRSRSHAPGIVPSCWSAGEMWIPARRM